MFESIMKVFRRGMSKSDAYAKAEKMNKAHPDPAFIYIPVHVKGTTWDILKERYA